MCPIGLTVDYKIRGCVLSVTVDYKVRGGGARGHTVDVRIYCARGLTSTVSYLHHCCYKMPGEGGVGV